MNNHPGAAPALSAIRAAFAVEITYTGAGLTAETIAAIPIEAAAPVFDGDIQSVRQSGYELQKADLPGEPADGDTVIDGGIEYRVIEVIERNDIAARVVMVEAV